MSGAEEDKMTDVEKQGLFKPIEKLNILANNDSVKLNDEDF